MAIPDFQTVMRPILIANPVAVAIPLGEGFRNV